MGCERVPSSKMTSTTAFSIKKVDRAHQFKTRSTERLPRSELRDIAPPLPKTLPPGRLRWSFVGAVSRTVRVMAPARAVVVLYPSPQVESPHAIYLVGRPRPDPPDSVSLDPVVRSASEAPVADRRSQGYRFSIEDQLPIRRAERRDNLVTTAAAAQMGRGREGHGHVERTLLQLGRDVLDEFVLQGCASAHGPSSLLSMFPSIVYVLWCSCSRSR